PAVRIVQRRRHRSGNTQTVSDRHGRAEPACQRSALDEFCDHVRHAIGLTKIEDSQNIRVTQSRNGHCLLVEARKQSRIVCEELRQYFDRHLTRQRWLYRSKYLRHAAFADLLNDPVLSERLSCLYSHSIIPGFQTLKHVHNINGLLSAMRVQPSPIVGFLAAAQSVSGLISISGIEAESATLRSRKSAQDCRREIQRR